MKARQPEDLRGASSAQKADSLAAAEAPILELIVRYPGGTQHQYIGRNLQALAALDRLFAARKVHYREGMTIHPGR